LIDLEQSISIRWHGITTDTNAIAIYIAGLECSKGEYLECPTANDLGGENPDKSHIFVDLGRTG